MQQQQQQNKKLTKRFLFFYINIVEIYINKMDTKKNYAKKKKQTNKSTYLITKSYGTVIHFVNSLLKI